jgi:hypothetical protein
MSAGMPHAHAAVDATCWRVDVPRPCHDASGAIVANMTLHLPLPYATCRADPMPPHRQHCRDTCSPYATCHMLRHYAATSAMLPPHYDATHATPLMACLRRTPHATCHVCCHAATLRFACGATSATPYAATYITLLRCHMPHFATLMLPLRYMPHATCHMFHATRADAMPLRHTPLCHYAGMTTSHMQTSHYAMPHVMHCHMPPHCHYCHATCRYTCAHAAMPHAPAYAKKPAYATLPHYATSPHAGYATCHTLLTCRHMPHEHVTRRCHIRHAAISRMPHATRHATPRHMPCCHVHAANNKTSRYYVTTCLHATPPQPCHTPHATCYIHALYSHIRRCMLHATCHIHCHISPHATLPHTCTCRATLLHAKTLLTPHAMVDCCMLHATLPHATCHMPHADTPHATSPHAMLMLHMPLRPPLHATLRQLHATCHDVTLHATLKRAVRRHAATCYMC